MTRAVAATLLALLAAGVASAQVGPPPAVEDVAVQERLGQPVPAGLTLTDASGRPATVGSLLAPGRPVILVFSYFQCPMLCGLVLRGLVDAARALDWRPGEQYLVAGVSIDPRDTALEADRRRRAVLAELGLPPTSAAWRFLVGDEAAVRSLADAVGFRYRRDLATGEYAHPAAIIVLTPTGAVSRYLYGIDFAARDLKLALLEASQGKSGSFFERVLMTCYRFDPATRRYGIYVVGLLRVGGLVLSVSVGGLIVVLWRRERRRRAAP